MFRNREDAAIQLALALEKYKNTNAVVVAVPRGGVPIGYVIAKKLNLPLELVLSKKIGHPYNKEYAIGAVTLQSSILDDAADNVSETYIESETQAIRKLLLERQQKYYVNKEPLPLDDKDVILVDDGIATGNTLISCIRLIQQQNPSRIIVALPVAPFDAIARIKQSLDLDEVICLLASRNFYAVGQFYEDFGQVSDAEVIGFLQKINNSSPLELST